LILSISFDHSTLITLRSPSGEMSSLIGYEFGLCCVLVEGVICEWEAVGWLSACDVPIVESIPETPVWLRSYLSSIVYPFGSDRIS